VIEAETADGLVLAALGARARRPALALIIEPDGRQSTRSGYREAGRPENFAVDSLLPILPVDSLNIKLGVDQLPVGFSPDHNRVSIRPYLIFRRRALDLLSPAQTDDVFSASNEADRLNRLSENQIMVSLNGLVPFGDLKEGKPGTLTLVYDVGVTNGSNTNSDPNTEKDVFGRVELGWYWQRLGFFGYWSPDIYDDNQRADAAIGTGTNSAPIMSGRQLANRMTAFGPDLRLSLEPRDIPVWLETEVLFNRESDPTGFKRSFSWWGGLRSSTARSRCGRSSCSGSPPTRAMTGSMAVGSTTSRQGA
jgi:hypothetical protein